MALASAALASSALTSACSGNYPLGSSSTSLDLIGDPAIAGASAAGDGRLPARLGPSDFSIGVNETSGPGTVAHVGDLDADGYEDWAQSSWDFANGASSVHIRYGGPRPRDPVEVLAAGLDGAYLAYALFVYDRPFFDLATVAAAGDVDADGFDDLLIETSDCTNTPGTGVYLVYGGAERLTATRPLASVAAHFLPPVYEGVSEVACGRQVAARGAGDLDGDGFDDLAITFAPVSSSDGTVILGEEGVFVHYGRSERFSGEVPPAAADAALRLPVSSLAAHPIGDVNGDGLADLLIGADDSFDPEDAFLLAGRGERYDGEVDVPAVATRLGGLYVDWAERLNGPADVDGDGIDDLLLRDREFGLHLFYGRPGLFAAGFDLAQADAVLQRSERTGRVVAVGDLDADGDEDLVDQFTLTPQQLPLPQEVALLSGSPDRLSQAFAFPEDEALAQMPPEGRFPGYEDRALTDVIPAGDLDGDGAGDLFSFSENRHVLSESSYETSARQLHVHYGTKAEAVATPR